MNHPIRVLIADDHAVMRSGLRLLLESQADMRVVDECGTHQEVLAALERHPDGIDVVSLDLSMPGGSAGALIEDVVRSRPEMGVVVLTMHDDASHARRALAAGARGYVVKSAADRELLAAIRAVADGRTHVGQAVGGEPVADPPVAGRPSTRSASGSGRCSCSWPRGTRTSRSPTGSISASRRSSHTARG
jgi:two-component system response regulator NreC